MSASDPEATYGLPPSTVNLDNDFLKRRRDALVGEYVELFQGIKDGRISVEDAASRQADREIQSEAENSHDPLTGLLNRRGFFELFDMDLLAFRRTIHNTQNPTKETAQDEQTTSAPVFGSLVLLDLDNFGIINKTKGDDFGDSVLQQVAIVLTEGVRPDDLVTRFGGEEFVLFLKGTNADDGAKVIERIRQALPQQTLTNSGYEQTATFGVMEFTQGLTEEQLIVPQNREVLFQQTYEGVIEAKKQGKDGGKNVTFINRGNGVVERFISATA